MKVHGDYESDGYALIEGLVPAEVASALLDSISVGLGGPQFQFPGFQKQEILTRRPTIEIAGHSFLPMLTFLWGLTPIVSQLTRRDLLPSFDYFRVYQQGDICKVHTDRPSSEHSLSMPRPITAAEAAVCPAAAADQPRRKSGTVPLRRQ